MKKIVLKCTAVALLIAALFVIVSHRSQASPLSAPVATQEKTVEQVQKNIKVLTGMPQSQLIPTMNFIAASLGKRCTFCHVNKAGQWDFASDEKPEKATAREMIKMVLDLHKLKVPGAGEVSCFTCHRGQQHPVNLPSLPLPLPSPRPPAVGPGSGPGTGAPPTTVAPQPSPPALPSADEIFNKYLTAIGGQTNIDKIKSRMARGAVTQPNGGPVTFEILQAAPDKFHITAKVGADNFERGFNGTVGWEKSARGVRQLTPIEVAQLQASLGLLRNISLKQQFTSTRVRAGEKIGDRPVFMVIGTTADNRQERLYFDAESGLLLRRVSYTPTMIGLIPGQIDFEDYRDVDGVKIPFTVRVASVEIGNPVSTRTFSEMKLNVPVEDSKFNQPPSNPN